VSSRAHIVEHLARRRSFRLTEDVWRAAAILAGLRSAVNDRHRDEIRDRGASKNWLADLWGVIGEIVALRHLQEVCDAPILHCPIDFARSVQDVDLRVLADEAGAAPERQRAQEFWDRGVLPIFNDLTTVLNEGDLTVLHGNWPAPNVGVEEVKASGRIKPGSRQAQRLDSKLSFLNTGRQRADSGGELGLWRRRSPTAIVSTNSRC
jgi:hypothetical protein